MFNNFEKENGKISQYHFIKFFDIDMILCNEVAQKFELVPEFIPERFEDSEYFEVFQFFFIDEKDINLLQNIDEPIYYCEDLDVYVLGFTNIGTGRDYILTNVNLIQNNEGLFYPSLS